MTAIKTPRRPAGTIGAAVRLRIANRLERLLPDKLAQAVRSVRASGALEDPLAALSHFRHRHALSRLTRALFYHRWTTALLLAHELGVFDALQRGPRTADELAADCHTHARSAEAILRILESQRLLASRDGRFELTPFARAYLVRGGEQSLTDTLDLVAAHAISVPEIAEGVKTGRSPAALDIFSDGGRYRAFLGAVNSYLQMAGRDLLARVELPEVRDFVVGSMGVSFSALVLERFPGARVTYGCLDHLVREIPSLRERYRVPPARVTGMHVHGGDPDADRWGDEAFDLVFLTKKMILDPEHDLGARFAKKALQVLRPGGAAIFWETVHTDGAPTPVPRAMEAVLDLGASPIGRVQTEGGIRRLLGEMGYHRVDVVPCLRGTTTFVVARKPG